MKGAIQSILAVTLDGYLKSRRLPPYLRRAVLALRRCRTSALGGHTRACPEGHVEGIWYNSCRHRSCPQCSHAKIEQWLARQRERLLPCDHYQVVLTLPSELRLLWLWNRTTLAELLFSVARRTVLELMAEPRRLGSAVPGIVAALHTWGRTLVLHPHLHLLVTAGGLAPEGKWRPVVGGFLLPSRQLRHQFRERFCAELARLLAAGNLLLPQNASPEDGQRWLKAARRKRWSARIEPPYAHAQGLATYLARYARGGPIKSAQILAFDDQHVTFRYRNHRDLASDGKPKPAVMTLASVEFLDRLLQHVPPPGLHVVRSWGLYSNVKTAELRRAHSLLADLAASRDPEQPPSRSARRPHDPAPVHLTCPVCGRLLERRQLPPPIRPPPRTLPDAA